VTRTAFVAGCDDDYYWTDGNGAHVNHAVVAAGTDVLNEEYSSQYWNHHDGLLVFSEISVPFSIAFHNNLVKKSTLVTLSKKKIKSSTI